MTAPSSQAVKLCRWWQMISTVNGIQMTAVRDDGPPKLCILLGQRRSNGRLWDNRGCCTWCFYGSKLFICAKLLKLFAGSCKADSVLMLPIKSHMKGKCVPIVCAVSVNAAGYLLRQFRLSTEDTQQRPSWDSNLLVTSPVF